MKKVKKALTIFLAVCLLASTIALPPVGVSAATVSVDGLTVTETFDSSAVLSDSLILYHNASQEVVNDAEKGSVLRITGSSANSRINIDAASKLTGYDKTKGKLVYSFDVKVESSTECPDRAVTLGLSKTDATGTPNQSLVYLRSNKVSCEGQSGTYTNGITDKGWYKVELIFDLEASQYTCKVNDADFKTDVAYTSTDYDPAKYLGFHLWEHADHTYYYYLDNLNIQYQSAVNVAQQTFDSSAALSDSLILYHNASQEVVNDAEKGSVLRVKGSSANSRINIDATSKLTGYDKTVGALVYSFDVKVESSTECPDRAVSLGLSKTDTTGSLNQSLVHLRSNKVSCEGQSGAYTNGITDKGWYKVELIFDLEESKYTCKVNDADFKTDVAYTSTDYDPAKYLGFHLWEHADHTYYYYLDNLNIEYKPDGIEEGGGTEGGGTEGGGTEGGGTEGGGTEGGGTTLPKVVQEDFDTLTAIGESAVVSVSGNTTLSAENGGKVLVTNRTSLGTLLTKIVPAITVASTGHVIYSFDSRIDMTGMSDELTRVNNLNLGDKTGNSARVDLMNLYNNRVVSTKLSGYTANVAENGWCNIKLDFDLAAKKVYTYIDGVLFKVENGDTEDKRNGAFDYSGVTMIDGSPFSPEKGICFETWIQNSAVNNYKHSIDNVRVGYCEAATGNVTGINISGSGLPAFAENTAEYTVELSREAYDALLVSDIQPLIKSGLAENTDYFKTVTLTEVKRGKKQVAEISMFPFGDYTVSFLLENYIERELEFFSPDFSTKNFETRQGNNNWYYMYTDNGTYKEMTLSNDGNTWERLVSGSRTSFINRWGNIQSPSAYVWKAPAKGIVRLTPEQNIYRAATHVNGTDLKLSIKHADDSFKIKKNDVWTATIGNTAADLNIANGKTYDEVLEVEAGDRIIFELQAANPSSATAVWWPNVNYVQQSVYEVDGSPIDSIAGVAEGKTILCSLLERIAITQTANIYLAVYDSAGRLRAISYPTYADPNESRDIIEVLSIDMPALDAGEANYAGWKIAIVGMTDAIGRSWMYPISDTLSLE